MLKLNAVAVDSSDSTDTVYNLCFPRAGRRIMAIKGAAGSRPSITVSKSKMKGGARLWIVGVDTPYRDYLRICGRVENFDYEDLLSEDEWTSDDDMTRRFLALMGGSP